MTVVKSGVESRPLTPDTCDGSFRAFITSGSYEAFAYEYDPYGVPTLTADSGGLGTTENPYGFSTGIQDRNTSWVQYGQRYYDPTTGTWTQLDTLDQPLDPANANRYAYAGGDPINNIDPTGKLSASRAGCYLFVGAFTAAPAAGAGLALEGGAAVGFSIGYSSFATAVGGLTDPCSSDPDPGDSFGDYAMYEAP